MREVVFTYGMEGMSKIKMKALTDAPSFADQLEDVIGQRLEVRSAFVVRSTEDDKIYKTMVISGVNANTGEPFMVKTSGETFVSKMEDYLSDYDLEESGGEPFVFTPIKRPSKQYAGKFYYVPRIDI